MCCVAVAVVQGVPEQCAKGMTVTQVNCAAAECSHAHAGAQCTWELIWDWALHVLQVLSFIGSLRKPCHTLIMLSMSFRGVTGSEHEGLFGGGLGLKRGCIEDSGVRLCLWMYMAALTQRGQMLKPQCQTTL